MKVIDYNVLVGKVDISGIPVIEAKPISRAHWLCSPSSYDNYYYCSMCGRRIYTKNFDTPLKDEFYFCPKCGSEMEMEEIYEAMEGNS